MINGKKYSVHNWSPMLPKLIHVPYGHMLVMHPFLPHAGHGGYKDIAAARVFMELQWVGLPDYHDDAISAHGGGTFLFGQLSPAPDFPPTPELADIFMSPSDLERIITPFV